VQGPACIAIAPFEDICTHRALVRVYEFAAINVFHEMPADRHSGSERSAL